MNRLAPKTDAAHLAAVKKYLHDHLRGAPMPDVWLESLEVVIRMAENNGSAAARGSADDSRACGGGAVRLGAPVVAEAAEPPAQPGSDTNQPEDGEWPADIWDHADDLERELAAAKEALAIAKQALAALATAEQEYRFAHQHYGGDDIRSGIAWDVMRKAGDAARRAIGEKT